MLFVCVFCELYYCERWGILTGITVSIRDDTNKLDMANRRPVASASILLAVRVLAGISSKLDGSVMTGEAFRSPPAGNIDDVTRRQFRESIRFR